MIRSMTAFARVEKITETINTRIEIKSYNSRYLDVKMHLTHGYQPLEEKIKARIAEQISRGRIELNVVIKDESEGARSFDIDIEKARAYYASLRKLKTMFSLGEEITLTHILGGGGIINPAAGECDMDALWLSVCGCLDEAVVNLNAMRKREGDYLAKDLNSRLDTIENLLGRISGGASGLLDLYKDKLSERMATLTHGMVEIDPQRIAQEAAFLADKSDISEEIVRANSHIRQFRSIMASDEPGGRKLNFLVQEFNREFNTMGSKIGNAEIAHMVVDVKSELEKIREQIQNIE